MYDYTFTIPHGVISITSGIIGLIRTGNPVFATPLVCGAIFLAIAVRSLKRFFRGMLSPDGVVVSLVLAVGLTYQMNKLLEETGLWWPCGSQRAVSAFMTVYYLWNLAFGPKPLDPPPPYNPPKSKGQ